MWWQLACGCGGSGAVRILFSGVLLLAALGRAPGAASTD